MCTSPHSLLHSCSQQFGKIVESERSPDVYQWVVTVIAIAAAVVILVAAIVVLVGCVLKKQRESGDSCPERYDLSVCSQWPRSRFPIMRPPISGDDMLTLVSATIESGHIGANKAEQLAAEVWATVTR